MRIYRILIIISCIMSTLSCAAKKYQIKVLNTPSITIDKKEAKVGDWFDDQSVIVWSKDNQAMRVVSEGNKVYTLSAKLYKESKSKTFADFIVYTKPLAARGTNNLDLIEQLAERFDQDFIMLDEIVIDLSDVALPNNAVFRLHSSEKPNSKYIEVSPKAKNFSLSRISLIRLCGMNNGKIQFIVMFGSPYYDFEIINDSCEISLIPLSIE